MKNYEKLFQSSSSQGYDAFAPTIDDKWSWIAMVDRLSNNDITKHEEVYNTNYIQVLNLLSYWKVKDDYINQMNKRNK
jgi:hypothetical protein